MISIEVDLGSSKMSPSYPSTQNLAGDFHHTSLIVDAVSVQTALPISSLSPSLKSSPQRAHLLSAIEAVKCELNLCAF